MTTTDEDEEDEPAYPIRARGQRGSSMFQAKNIDRIDARVKCFHVVNSSVALASLRRSLQGLARYYDETVKTLSSEDVVDERLDGRARLVGRGAGDQRERVETGDVGDCRASRAATEVDQQSPITARDPTRSEGEALACLGGDVRYPELVVDDLDVVAADVFDSGLADRRAEGRAARGELSAATATTGDAAMTSIEKGG